MFKIKECLYIEQLVHCSAAYGYRNEAVAKTTANYAILS